MKSVKVVGCILAALQFVLAAIFVYMIFITSLVPFKIMVVIAVVMAILPILVVIMMKGRSSALLGILLSIIVSVITCFGIYYINSTNKALDEVTGNKTEVEQINVYVKKDDPIDSINEAVDSEYVFGIVTNDASEGVSSVIKQINQDLGKGPNIREFESIYDVVISLQLNQINGFIVNSELLGILESSDSYIGYSDTLKILLEKEIETEVVEEVREKEPFDTSRFCMYISGIDTYGSVNVKSRSDVNIIAIVNIETRTMLLVSTPRDYYVDFPNLGNKKDKLTHAGVFGIDASMSTLEQLYDIDLNYYVRMNFSGFENIVDELGGIDVYSEVAFTAIVGEEYSQGINHLDGKRALTFARERYAFMSGDRQRGNNQMAVIKAIVSKMESSDMLANYSNIMDALAGSFQTDMSKDEVGAIVQRQLSDMKSWNIYTYSVNGSDGMDMCSSVGVEAYVMYPNQSDVDYAKTLISKVMNDGTLNQDEINEYMNR